VPAHGYAARVPVFLSAAIMLFAVGCTAAQSAMPTPSHEAAFSPMPIAPIVSGNVQYKTLLGPLTGTGAKVFPVPVWRTYMLWLGCRGTGGFAVVESSLLGLNTEMPCESSGRISGYQFSSPHNSSAKMAILRANGPRGARWELRIDAEPQAG
jgi:hypothetical protein